MTSLRVITPPAIEPVSLETARAYLRVDLTSEDFLIQSLIKAARERGEALARRAFVTQTLELVCDGWPLTHQLALWRPPLQSVVSVTYYDRANVAQTWSDYRVDVQSDPGQVYFNSLPGTPLRESGGIAIRYTAGYGADDDHVPERIRALILSAVAHLYEHREEPSLPKGIRDGFTSLRSQWFLS